MNETALAVMQPQSLALPARAGADAVRHAMGELKAIRTFIKEELQENLDYGVIPGTGEKPTLYLPGAQKVAMYFNTYPRFDIKPRELGEGHVEYVITTRLVNRSNRQVVGAGIGSCSTMESKYRFRKAARGCPECGATTIIKGKEEYGGGWVCFRKKGGCGAKFAIDDRSIVGQASGQVENENIHDQRNTVLKMAKKRSQVDAALGLGCLSELFTQDIDDTYVIDPDDAPQVPPKSAEADGRREVNEQFRAKGPGRDRAPAPEPTPAPPAGWAEFSDRLIERFNRDWLSECDLEGVPVPQDWQAPMVRPRLENGIATMAIDDAKVDPTKIAKASKPDVRDPMKAWHALEWLYRKDPEWVELACEAYAKRKLQEARKAIGSPLAEAEDDEQPEAVTAKAGEDDGEWTEGRE